MKELKRIIKEAYLKNKEWVDSLPKLEEVFDLEELKKNNNWREL